MESLDKNSRCTNAPLNWNWKFLALCARIARESGGNRRGAIDKELSGSECSATVKQ